MCYDKKLIRTKSRMKAVEKLVLDVYIVSTVRIAVTEISVTFSWFIHRKALKYAEILCEKDISQLHDNKYAHRSQSISKELKNKGASKGVHINPYPGILIPLKRKNSSSFGRTNTTWKQRFFDGILCQLSNNKFYWTGKITYNYLDNDMKNGIPQKLEMNQVLWEILLFKLAKDCVTFIAEVILWMGILLLFLLILSLNWS